jgi:hypothetical protein
MDFEVELDCGENGTHTKVITRHSIWPAIGDLVRCADHYGRITKLDDTGNGFPSGTVAGDYF